MKTLMTAIVLTSSLTAGVASAGFQEPLQGAEAHMGAGLAFQSATTYVDQERVVLNANAGSQLHSDAAGYSDNLYIGSR
ncbi:hypothetical protein [Marinobacterium arenosum]|uniref:hypothetical protein n=1 Tax=Marinobacterium arenosum TaxID=2862496 RepID=UPI001C969784|nr:hypothetical protein [Marinobacterium arenosum]MBY4678008.1 hypothetical protein [Marinobacterium arenosum]